MDILLTTLNARYYHTAPALLYLKANLGDLEPRAKILEFGVKQDPDRIVDTLLAEHPKVLLISVYIWNVEPTREVVRRIRTRAPEVRIVLGGPEVSYAPQDETLMALADVVVCGEGEKIAPILCRELLEGRAPAQKVIATDIVPMEELLLPYHLYTDEDVAHRIVYVETSRGCPYKCEYCLSSLDRKVRFFDLDELFPAFERLIERGVRLFKLLDRTFNTRIPRAVQILEFFLARWQPGMCLHMEMIPDRIPPELREVIQKFPAGGLQFEIGVQSYNQEILDRIQRRQEVGKVHENIDWLCRHTGAEIHADLIIGLPGETEESFAVGFDALVGLYPQHIQVNLLKLLKGTPIVRHTQPFGMVYDPVAPFEVLETSVIPRPAMDRLRTFARFWTLYHNRGRFRQSLRLIWTDGRPYERMQDFAQFASAYFGRQHNIQLVGQAEALLTFYESRNLGDPDLMRQALSEDLEHTGVSPLPAFLRPVGA